LPFPPPFSLVRQPLTYHHLEGRQKHRYLLGQLQQGRYLREQSLLLPLLYEARSQSKKIQTPWWLYRSRFQQGYPPLLRHPLSASTRKPRYLLPWYRLNEAFLPLPLLRGHLQILQKALPPRQELPLPFWELLPWLLLNLLLTKLRYLLP